MGLFDKVVAKEPAPTLDVDQVQVAKHGIQVAERQLEREAAFQPIVPETTPGGAQLLLLARSSPRLDDARMAVFLDALSQVPDEHLAALAAGVTIIEARRAKRDDQAFATAWEMAASAAVGFAEKEAFRRAIHGVSKPILYQGAPTGFSEVTYSDQLMGKILAANNPRYESRSNIKAEVNANVNWQSLMEAMQKPADPQ